MKLYKRLLAAIIMTASLITATPYSASAYDNESEYGVSGFDVAPDNSGLFVFTNEGASPKAISASEYDFSGKRIMIFNSQGRLVEAGGDIYGNSDVVWGSPQLSVTIPAGGFMAVFNESAIPALNDCYTTAMEGAMLYNATMAVAYEVIASYDRSANKLYVKYNDPKAPGADAKKFLFVGNSSTYFNGTPIQFKALAAAAGVEIAVDYCTFGSATLSQFADETHERGIALRSKLENGDYDYVVLQDANGATYETTRAQIDILLPLIKDAGAEALLYMRYGFADNWEKRMSEAQRHHITYTRLATELGLTCAAAADAFSVCYENYPEINLYADDGNHHSASAAYLIACVWLREFLGIDPVGNSYIATQDADTAKKLQECAKIAADEGYVYPNSKDAVTIGGKTYKNVAVGKGYTPSGAPYGNASWTDTGSDGNPLGKLTDGVFAAGGGDTAIGCYKGSSTSVTIDLEADYDIYGFYTDLFGGQWSVPVVSDATAGLEYSLDGNEYTKIESIDASESEIDGWGKKEFSFTLNTPVKARYIRVSYEIGGIYCWSSEIALYGVKSAEPDPGDNNDNNGDSNNDDNNTDTDTDTDTENSGDTEKFIKGDVNINGKIDARDYLLLKRAFFGTYDLTCGNEVSDINGNGRLDARDYLLLKRAFFGTYTIR